MASLPEAPTAAGFRRGAVETLALEIGAVLGAHTTGHDLCGISALWEYMGASLGLCVPGNLVLAGWKAPLGRGADGELGRGAVVPSLQPLRDAGIDAKRLDDYADLLFQLHDDMPEQLRKGGSLRPMIEACLASMIMYYEVRSQLFTPPASAWCPNPLLTVVHPPPSSSARCASRRGRCTWC